MDAPRRSTVIVGVGLCLSGCGLQTTPIPDNTGSVEPLPPVVLEVSWSCDADLERWRLDIACEGWTNGGRLYLSDDFQYVEEHGVKSRKSSPDGTSDDLRLDLSLVSDWREVAPGSSTVFHCNQSPDGLFVIYNRENEVADCRVFGENPDGWATLDNIPGCETQWADTGR